MPTYMCYVHEGQVTAEQKSQIAAGIAQIHSRFTGAPVSFCQCVFRDLKSDDHFIGLQPAPHNGVFVYGHIRAERPGAAKNHILMGIRDLLTRLLLRAGFLLEGRLTRHAVYPNLGPEPRDSLLYAQALR